jgi:hypothetical protein
MAAWSGHDPCPLSLVECLDLSSRIASGIAAAAADQVPPQLVCTPPFEETIADKGGDVAGTIRAAAAVADRVFFDFVKSSDLSDPDHVRALAGALSAGLIAARDRLALPAFALPAVVEALALKATTSFLDGDLFTSMVRFLGDAHGSFGLTVCCSLDRNVTCIASRGQAMCLSFNAEAGAVLWGSESATQASRRSESAAVPAPMPHAPCWRGFHGAARLSCAVARSPVSASQTLQAVF